MMRVFVDHRGLQASRVVAGQEPGDLEAYHFIHQVDEGCWSCHKVFPVKAGAVGPTNN